MPDGVRAVVILATWAVLLALYAVNRYGVRGRLPLSPIVVDLAGRAAPARAGSLLSGAGTLLVFLANVATIALVLLSWLAPPLGGTLDALRVWWPLWLQVVGAALFVLYSLCGLLVVVFNPSYTPLYRRLSGRFVIATEGPYRWVRHPRYAVEAALNIGLVLFAGFWTPLLGLVGWPALYAQARAEEQLLLTLAPDAYAEYRRRTGMFFPRLGRLLRRRPAGGMRK